MLKARLGDPSDHGGVIITASPNVLANDIPVARLGDLHACPIHGHGVTPIGPGSPTVMTDDLPTLRVGDTAGCGATIIMGSPTVLVV